MCIEHLNIERGSRRRWMRSAQVWGDLWKWTTDTNLTVFNVKRIESRKKFRSLAHTHTIVRIRGNWTFSAPPKCFFFKCYFHFDFDNYSWAPFSLHCFGQKCVRYALNIEHGMAWQSLPNKAKRILAHCIIIYNVYNVHTDWNYVFRKLLPKP